MARTKLPATQARCTHIGEDGTRCPKMRTQDMPLCQAHFDATVEARAADSPITGRRMKVLGRLKDDYAKALVDPDILRMEPAIALIDVRLIELIERIHTGDTSDYRKRVQELLKAWTHWLDKGDEEKAGKAYKELCELVEDGVSRDRAWEAAIALSQRRNAMAGEATELLLKSKQVVQHGELVKIIRSIVLLIMEEVPREAAVRVVHRVSTEVMGRRDSASDGQAETGLGQAVRSLPGAPSGVLSGSLGSGPVVEAMPDR